MPSRRGFRAWIQRRCETPGTWIFCCAAPIPTARGRAALEAAGFVHRRVTSLGRAGALDVFLDGPDAKVRDAVHILWAGERGVPDAIEPTPELGRTEPADGFELIPLEDLLRMKLTSFCDKDRMHLRDLASVGLVDAGWLAKFPETLGARLQAILDDPEG